jgi:hypothetical protein
MTENLKTKVINKCPECDHKLDAAICPKEIDAKPNAGDLSMCFHCYAILQFTKKLKLKKINMNNLSSEDKESLLLMRQEAIKAKEWYKGLH